MGPDWENLIAGPHCRVNPRARDFLAMAAHTESDFATTATEIVHATVLAQEEGQPVPDRTEPATSSPVP